MHRLAHDPQWRRGICQRCQRPFIDVQDRDTPGLQASLAGVRLHGNHLPDCQMLAAGSNAVFAHGDVFAEMHFHAIDADRGKPGDGADDTGATGTVRRTRTAGSTGPLLDRRPATANPAIVALDTGASHAARPRPGTTGAARKLQARSVGHADFIAADTHRCCVPP